MTLHEHPSIDQGSEATITEPGVYTDLPSAVYHAQTDWLSWSSMKFLLPTTKGGGTPAHFKARLDADRQENKRAWDLGKVVHTLALGDGDEFVAVMALDRSKVEYEARDYDTVSAKAHRDAIYADGKVPILATELEAAKAMAAALKAHPVSSILLDGGRPEVSLFWVDVDTGVKCRARLDWLPDVIPGRRLIVPDVKTAQDASPSGFAKAAANFGYFGQQRHYQDGIEALIGADPAFLFAVVETGTNLVNVGQFALPEDLSLARRTVDHCRRLYRDCLAIDTWPGYGDGINDLSLPSWLHYSLGDALA